MSGIWSFQHFGALAFQLQHPEFVYRIFQLDDSHILRAKPDTAGREPAQQVGHLVSSVPCFCHLHFTFYTRPPPFPDSPLIPTFSGSWAVPDASIKTFSFVPEPFASPPFLTSQPAAGQQNSQQTCCYKSRYCTSLHGVSSSLQ